MRRIFMTMAAVGLACGLAACGNNQASQVPAKKASTHRASKTSDLLSTSKTSHNQASSAASEAPQSASSSAQVASETANTSSAVGVDVKNLTTAQVKDWVMRNMEKYAADAYDYGSEDEFGWQFGSDDQGQLTVFVTENHAYMNAHGANGDPNTAPTVGSFTVTSNGELEAQGVGMVGMQICGGPGSKIIASSFAD